MSIYKHKSLKNKRCGSSGCDNPSKKRVLFSLGFSASLKCADELIRNNLGVEDVHTDSAEKDENIAKGGLIGENE
jgi:hypothetical protein